MLAPFPCVLAWRLKMLAEPTIAAFMAGPHRQPSPADQATGDQYFQEVKDSLNF